MPEFDAIGTRVCYPVVLPLVIVMSSFSSCRSAGSSTCPGSIQPRTSEAFDGYLRSRKPDIDEGFLICCRESGRILGVININCIVWGFFKSGYLGYYLGAPYARQGYMTEGMQLVIRYAFTQIGLHRLEANIQPDNLPSIALVRKCGFRKEGFSPTVPEGPWPVARP